MTEIQKQKMIKLIHTQKTRAGIDDETYRLILFETADVKSTLDMQTPSQFNNVITALNNLLTAQKQQPLGGTTQRISRNVYPLVKRAERVFGSDMDKRFGGFIRKLGKNSVNDLSPEEIRKCHGFLSHIEYRGVK